jgi:hypothetical protein
MSEFLLPKKLNVFPTSYKTKRNLQPSKETLARYKNPKTLRNPNTIKNPEQP